MKHLLLAVITVFLGSSAHAEGWSGDLLCVKSWDSSAGHYFSWIADAIGTIRVTNTETADPVVSVQFSELRTYVGYGYLKMEVLKDVEFSGTSVDGNDTWLGKLEPMSDLRNVRGLELDLSSSERGLSRLKAKAGQDYLMDCTVRYH